MPLVHRAWAQLPAVAAPLLVLLLGLVAIASILTLQARSTASRDAQLKLATVTLELSELQTAPFQAHASTGGSPVKARARIDGNKAKIEATLAALNREAPPAALRKTRGPLRANYAAVDKIYALGASEAGYGRAADQLGTEARRVAGIATGLLGAASREYDRRASRAQLQATLGAIALILLLLFAFGLLYRRAARARGVAERLVVENAGLLALSRHEALHDALTGLPNRRALIGERLATALDGIGTAYRMGGDEFCVVAPLGATRVEQIPALAGGALSETGDAFDIGCAYGVAQVPTEAASVVGALHLADQRMYEHKAGRSSASRQSTDVLLQVLSERSTDLHEHLTDVARLATLTAERLGLPDHEVTRIDLAAELHDVGKTAIPDTILNKAGKLNEEEWGFMRGHTLVGERIVRAAPSLAHTADLVRSCHERFDGAGYPDGIAGGAIPLGASIIAVCDAFDAMVSDRPYRSARSRAEAIAEIRRCASTQFDPAVAEAFCALAEAPVAPAAQTA